MATLLARKGWSLILTGRNEQELAALQRTLPTEVQILPLDLATEDAPFRLYRFCRKKSVDLLVNNAGFGTFGTFAQTDLHQELDMIAVNIRAVHILTKLFLRDFRKRDWGRILNVASSAGFLTGPLMATYYASKNYVVRLSLAIAEELRREHSNVTISCLCPGPVQTHFNERAGVEFRVPPLRSDVVARYALEQTFAGKKLIVPGGMMQLALIGARFVPNGILSAITYQLQVGRRKLEAPVVGTSRKKQLDK
jgi:short-subunit dehydrogenase